VNSDTGRRAGRRADELSIEALASLNSAGAALTGRAASEEFEATN
jgi:hypothetical protein